MAGDSADNLRQSHLSFRPLSCRPANLLFEPELRVKYHIQYFVLRDYYFPVYLEPCIPLLRLFVLVK